MRALNAMVCFPSVKSRGLWAVLAALFCVTFSVGCKVGPEYGKPDAPFGNDWIDGENPRLVGQLEDPKSWWVVFGDQQLNALVERAASDNLTLKEAGMRVAEARYQRRITAGSLFPQQQSVYGQHNYRQLSQNNANFFPGLALREFDQVALGMDAAWELDFWGRFRRSVEAADAELNSSIERFDDAMVVLLAEVASTYIEIRTLERRLAYARENLDIQRGTLELVTRKFEGGAVSELDVAQSNVNVKQTEAAIPALEIAHRQACNRLCTLMGMPPVDLDQILGRTGVIPLPPEQVALGVPADLLRQRPDVRRIERQLAAQSARIGVAKSEFYPHISITGAIGVESKFGSTLFEKGSVAGYAGPSFRWNVLNYGRIKNNVLLQDAAFQRLAYTYQNSVLEANRQVEDALVSFIKTHDRIASLEEGVESAIKTVTISEVQYREGAIDFNRVFLLQTEKVRQQDQLAIAQGELARSLVAVYKGLGGGWQIRLSEGPLPTTGLVPLPPPEPQPAVPMPLPAK